MYKLMYKLIIIFIIRLYVGFNVFIIYLISKWIYVEISNDRVKRVIYPEMY